MKFAVYEHFDFVRKILIEADSELDAKEKWFHGEGEVDHNFKNHEDEIDYIEIENLEQHEISTYRD